METRLVKAYVAWRDIETLAMQCFKEKS